MSNMPCKCPGYKVERCKCKVLRGTGRCDDPGNVVLLTHSNSICRLIDLKEKNKQNFILRIIENIYEICAGYNLRYCPIRGFLRHGNHFGNTVKDFMILMCFLIANFIVFLTIVTKMLVHMYLMLMMTAQWIRKSLISKHDSNEEMINMCSSRFKYDYTPPRMSQKIW